MFLAPVSVKAVRPFTVTQENTHSKSLVSPTSPPFSLVESCLFIHLGAHVYSRKQCLGWFSLEFRRCLLVSVTKMLGRYSPQAAGMGRWDSLLRNSLGAMLLKWGEMTMMMNANYSPKSPSKSKAYWVPSVCWTAGLHQCSWVRAVVLNRGHFFDVFIF